jgi:23S rRNA (adenine2503-C2)-methyltransferase
MGFLRNLTPAEVVEQYVILNRQCGHRIGNIVFMGMGEPFANIESVFTALGIFTDPDSFGLSGSRITVSTSGIFSGIQRIIEEYPKVHLMVSLHSAIQEVRDRIMPNLSGQKLETLRQWIPRYIQATGRELTLEYVMLCGVNDRATDLRALVDFCRGMRVKVNLIAWNRVDGMGLDPTPSTSIREFKERLEEQGIPAIQRYKKGDDIAAACGQLATQN